MFSKTAGLETIELGLLLTPEKIITACKRHQPDLSGLTVLQFYSEEDILMINKKIISSCISALHMINYIIVCKKNKEEKYAHEFSN